MRPQDLPDKLAELAELLEDSRVGIIARDLVGTITYANQRMAEWLGYPIEELVGRPQTDCVPPEYAASMDEERVLTDSGQVRLRLTVVQRRDSSTFAALVAPAPVREDGEVLGVVLVILDVGEIQTARSIAGTRLELRTHDERDLAALDVGLEDLPELAGLTPRERQVVGAIVHAYRVREIAVTLGISENTVRNHLKAIYQKLGVKSQGEAVSVVRSYLARHRG